MSFWNYVPKSCPSLLCKALPSGVAHTAAGNPLEFIIMGPLQGKLPTLSPGTNRQERQPFFFMLKQFPSASPPQSCIIYHLFQIAKITKSTGPRKKEFSSRKIVLGQNNQQALRPCSSSYKDCRHPQTLLLCLHLSRVISALHITSAMHISILQKPHF